jgi:chemotaxis protein MotB
MAGRRKKPHHEEEHENEERWLVSFADMMTLLFCLFMVLFAISSVNTSKFEALQRSLQDAFSCEEIGTSRSKTDHVARLSASSPTCVPVACAFTYAMSSRPTRASSSASSITRRMPSGSGWTMWAPSQVLA